MASLTISGDAAIIHHLQNTDTSYLHFEQNGAERGRWIVHQIPPKTEKPSFLDKLFTSKKTIFKEITLDATRIKVSTTTYEGKDSLELEVLRPKITELAKKLFGTSVHEGFEILEDSGVGGLEEEPVYIQSDQMLLEEIMNIQRALNQFARKLDNAQILGNLSIVEEFTQLQDRIKHVLTYFPKHLIIQSDKKNLDTIKTLLETLPKFERKIETLLLQKKDKFKSDVETASREMKEKFSGKKDRAAAMAHLASEGAYDRVSNIAVRQVSPVVEEMVVDSILEEALQMIIEEQIQIQTGLSRLQHGLKAQILCISDVRLVSEQPGTCDLFDDQEDLLNLKKLEREFQEKSLHSYKPLTSLEERIIGTETELDQIERAIREDQMLREPNIIQSLENLKRLVAKANELRKDTLKRIETAQINHPYNKLLERNRQRVDLLQSCSLILRENKLSRPMLSMKDGKLKISQRPFFGSEAQTIVIHGQELYVEKSSVESIKKLLFLAEVLDNRPVTRDSQGTPLALPARIKSETHHPKLAEYKAEFKTALMSISK